MTEDKEFIEFMNEVTEKLRNYGLRPNDDTKILYLIFDQLRKLNLHIEELLSKFKGETP